MRRMFVALIPLLFLPGCLDDTAPGDDGPDGPMDGLAGGPEGQTLAWGLQDCQAVIGVFPVPAAAVAPHLPEGFTPAPFKDALGIPLPTDLPGQDGNFGVEMMVCASGTGRNGTSEAITSYGSYFAAVITPDAYVRDVDLHFVKWDVGIPDAERRDLLVAAGVPAVDISTDFLLFDGIEPVGLAADGSLRMGELSDRMDALSAAPNNDFPVGSFVEYTQTPAGLVEWQATFTWSRSGLGIVHVDPDGAGLAGQVLGGPAVGAGFVGDVDFHDGFILLPGPSAGEAL